VNDKKVVNTAYSPLVQELINQQQVILRKNWLPLKDLFCNHKLEFDFTLDDLRILFESLGISQTKITLARV